MRRRRCQHCPTYDREDMVFDPIHYLPLLEHKIGALAKRMGTLMPSQGPAPSPGGAHASRHTSPGPSACETFDLEVPHGAVKDALRLGASATTPSNTLCWPYRATPGQTRPSIPTCLGPDVATTAAASYIVGWRRVMTDTPQVLLVHHLKTLKLPTFPARIRQAGRQDAPPWRLMCAFLSV